MPHEAAENLVALLREIVQPAQDVDVAVHPELRRVLVFSLGRRSSIPAKVVSRSR